MNIVHPIWSGLAVIWGGGELEHTTPDYFFNPVKGKWRCPMHYGGRWQLTPWAVCKLPES